MSTDPVLVVGAGPVGMVLACDLLAQGVAVRLVDEADGPRPGDPHSRAVVVVPRTLELLRRIGVSERLIAAGRAVPAIRYHADGRRLGTARMDCLPDTPYPFLLALPQRETERILRERLAELGGRVERQVALEALDVEDTRPVALLRHADGSAESVRPWWVAGADGAASTTRKLLGVRLRGDPTDVTYLIADAPIDGPMSRDARYFYSRDGLVAIVPLRDGLYRIAGNVDHRRDGEEPRWRDVLAQIVERTHVPLDVGEPTYARFVRPRCGVAEAFRRGPCFLLGDAAHVITPAGGQGMNLGIQDAMNLGWKLGGVTRGRLADGVLDSYDAERRPATLRMSATTARVVGLATLRSAPKAALRDATLAAAGRAGLVQRTLAPMLSQLDVDYGRPEVRRPWRRRARRMEPGRRVPPVDPAFARDDYTVVLWPGGRPPRDWRVRSAELRARLAGCAEILDAGALPLGARRALRHALGGQPVIAAVRPDGHVGHLAPLDHPGRTRGFLASVACAT